MIVGPTWQSLPFVILGGALQLHLRINSTTPKNPPTGG
jgi:hypothetical protein